MATWWFWPEQGLLNPCLSTLPRKLADHELVRSAWLGLDPAQVWDCHAHLVGTGDSGSGIWLNPALDSMIHPMQYAQRLFFLNAGCAHDAPGRVDQSYVERMQNLLEGMRPGAKLMLFAFDYFHREDGAISRDDSAFHVPNDYARNVARQHPRYFEWVASIHPYRRDCVEALTRAAAEGARAVKWLPAAQGMNPSSPLCDRFFEALAKLDLPLISHAGEERAVHGGNTQHFGNPLLLRRALDHGVRVVVAHCGHGGTCNMVAARLFRIYKGIGKPTVYCGETAIPRMLESPSAPEIPLPTEEELNEADDDDDLDFDDDDDDDEPSVDDF